MTITGADFARLAGIKRQAIYDFVRRGKLIKNKDGKYDLSNETNRQYLINKGKTKKEIENFIEEVRIKKESKNKVLSKTKKTKVKKEKSIDVPVKQEKEKVTIREIETDDDFVDISDLPAKMMDLNLKQLVNRYGGPMQLKTWADILNKLMMANEKDQRIQERRIELIEKDFVISRLFSYLETLSLQLFDYPESTVDQLIALISSGADNLRIKIIEVMKKDLSLLIRESKKNIDRELEQQMNKHKKDADEDE